MTNIRAEVWKLIDTDPSLRYDMERNLLNVRAVARYFMELGIDATEDAIISAIRRYPRENQVKDYNKNVLKLLSKSTISTRSNIVNIAISKGSHLKEVLPQIFSIIKFEKGEILRITQGEENIRIIIDQKNFQSIMEVIPKKEILEIRKDLAEINIHLPKEVAQTRGLGAYLFNELLRHDILLYEVMSCLPEFMFFVQNDQALKTHEVLFGLINQNKKKED